MAFCGENDYVTGVRKRFADRAGVWNTNIVYGIAFNCLKNELITSNFKLHGHWKEKVFCKSRQRITGFKFKAKDNFLFDEVNIKFLCEDGFLNIVYFIIGNL